MKKSFAGVLILALSATAALADGPSLPPPPVVVPPPAMVPDWTGLYVGAFGGMSQGEMFDLGGPYVLNNNASLVGGFVGYRRDLGDWVIGGELATTAGINISQAAFPGWEFNRMTDARVSLGRDLGRALVYVSAGYSTSSFSGGLTNYTYDGWNAGIGIDVMLGDRVFVGAEYVHRSVSRTTDRSWTGEFGTVQLRAGVRF